MHRTRADAGRTSSLIAEHWERVYRVHFLVSRDQRAAEDLTQETMLTLATAPTAGSAETIRGVTSGSYRIYKADRRLGEDGAFRYRFSHRWGTRAS